MGEGGKGRSEGKGNDEGCITFKFHDANKINNVFNEGKANGSQD